MKRFGLAAIVLLAPLSFADAQHRLPATPETVVWGYYDGASEPVLRIKSGETVEIHTLIVTGPEELEAAGVAPEQVEQALRDVHREVTREGPHILTGPIYIEDAMPGDVLFTMGMHEDLLEAARIAVRRMIEFLQTEKGLSADDAYMLASIAVDLRITQLVDGNLGVHAMLWKSLFAD